MPTTAEGPQGRRLALVVATESYADPTLAQLRAPGRDASDLAAVLADAAVGRFEVETLLDAPAEALRRGIAHFCGQVGPRDLVLVYLSCHGVLDDRGRLYYATADTDRELLSATAVPSAWLNEQLEDCRSRRQILLLDCCHSGAFAKGAKGEGELALQGRFEGRGRVVLTGSRGTEYSFEQQSVVGESASSVFTSALVDGLRSGDADRDGDGLVTISELYDHAYEAVRTKEARQTPTLWTYGAEGDLLVAHSPRGPIIRPAPLPEDLLSLLESARPRVREGAVAELADLLGGSDAGRALSARQALEGVAAGDLPSVAGAARAALESAALEARSGASPPAGAPAPPAEPPSPPPPPAAADRRPPGAPRSAHRRLDAIIAAAAALLVIGAIVIAISSGGGGGHPGIETFDPGGSPRGVATAEGDTWITGYASNEVTRIDSSSNVEPFRVGVRPGKIAAGEGAVWVGFDEGRKLARIFPATKPPLTIPFGEGCDCTITELAIKNGRLWVGSQEDQSVTAYNLRTGREEGDYGALEGFEGVFALDRNAIWAVGIDEGEPSGAQLTRVDIATQEKKLKFQKRNSHFGGVAYGDERVWIADVVRNVVWSFVTETQHAEQVEIATGIHADDIAFAGDSVLVWDPVKGILSRIDLDPTKLGEQLPVDGYEKDQDLNLESSDLSVDEEGFAWVTSPAQGTVYKVDYGGGT